VFDALEGCAAFELVDSRFRDLKSRDENTPYEFYAITSPTAPLVSAPSATTGKNLTSARPAYR